MAKLKDKVEETVKEKKVRKPKTTFTCGNCHKIFPIEEICSVEGYSNKKLCHSCADEYFTSVKELDKLKDYILKMLPLSKEYYKNYWAFWMTQISYLKKTYNWTYAGMRGALSYAHKMQGLEYFNPETGVQWIIERYYGAAEKYWAEVELVHNMAQQADESCFNLPIKEIVFTTAELEYLHELDRQEQKRLLYGPPINLDDLPDEEGENE